MIEVSVISLFAVSLVVCIGFDISILAALVFGFFLFFGYGLYKKHTVQQMLALAFSGIKTVKNILITFILIGIITATWRACGTIPYIVYHATEICSPGVMVLITALSLTNGFIDELLSSTLQATPHVTLTSFDGSLMPEDELILEALAAEAEPQAQLTTLENTSVLSTVALMRWPFSPA